MKSRSDGQARFWLYTAIAWLLIVTLLWLSPAMLDSRFPGISAAGGVLCLAWLQYFLVQLMHEESHHHFAREGSSGFIAALLTAYPIGFSRRYRDIHLTHHKFFGDPQRDCDYAGYAYFPRSKLEMLKWICRNGSGVAAIWQFLGQTEKPQGQQRNAELVWIVLVQLTLLGFFSWHGSWWMYAVFWLLPLLTLVKLLSTLRLLAEHGDPELGIVLRDFDCPVLLKNIMGPVGFGDHAKHHQAMATPFGELGTIRINEKLLKVPYKCFDGHHFQLLAGWFRDLPLTAGKPAS